MPARRYRFRGSMYVPILMIAMIVAVIGLSGVTVARLQLRSSEGARDTVAARFYAESAIELGMLALSLASDGGASLITGDWRPEQSIGDGTCTWKLVSETSGDQLIDALTPVRVYGKGVAGDAVRVFSVLVMVGNAADANLLINGDIEDGLTAWEDMDDCDMEASENEPHGGTVCLRIKSRNGYWAGPRQEISEQLSKGTTYAAEVWVRLKDQPETIRLGMWLWTGSGWSWYSITTAYVGTSWTKVSSTFTPSWSGTLLEAYWKVETDWSNQEFWIDDAVVIEQDTSEMPINLVPGTWRRELGM